MQRLFVAIQPPDAIRRQLLSLMGGIACARWQRDDQLHLTLRFIGEADRHLFADVTAALGRIHHPRFEVTLDGIGQFDRRGRVDNLWVGVTPHQPLKTLHNKIDQALTAVGIPPETRNYHPHITIARFGREAGGMMGFMADAGGVRSTPFEIRDFCLFESQPTQDGSVYTIVERYALD